MLLVYSLDCVQHLCYINVLWFLLLLSWWGANFLQLFRNVITSEVLLCLVCRFPLLWIQKQERFVGSASFNSIIMLYWLKVSSSLFVVNIYCSIQTKCPVSQQPFAAIFFSFLFKVNRRRTCILDLYDTALVVNYWNCIIKHLFHLLLSVICKHISFYRTLNFSGNLVCYILPSTLLNSENMVPSLFLIHEQHCRINISCKQVSYIETVITVFIHKTYVVNSKCFKTIYLSFIYNIKNIYLH